MVEPDGKCAVVDHSRTNIPLLCVIIPVYPGDMISVKGDQDEIWHAEVWQVDLERKRVKGYFFVKRVHRERNHLWVRKSSSWTMDSINFKSIIDTWQGIWHGPNWQEQIQRWTALLLVDSGSNICCITYRNSEMYFLFWVKVGIYIPLFLQQQKEKDYYSVLLIAKDTYLKN